MRRSRHPARQGEITRDIPNVGEEALDLDDVCIVRIAPRSSGRHPRRQDHAEGRDQLSPEEKLLRAISASAPATCGHSLAFRRRPGVVIGARVFAARDRQDERAQASRRPRDLLLSQARRVKIISSLLHKMRELLVGKTRVAPGTTRQGPDRKAKESSDQLNEVRTATGTRSARLRDGKIEEQLEQLAAKREESLQHETQYSRRIAKLTRATSSRGVIKLVKVYLRSRGSSRSVTRWAVRHGNKGSSRRSSRGGHAVPRGRDAVDIVQPLGVPSRMNIGQILEVPSAGPRSARTKIQAYLDTLAARCSRTSSRSFPDDPSSSTS